MEPVGGQPLDLLECAGFLEEVGRTRNDPHLNVRGLHSRSGFVVEIDHGFVVAADYEQRRRDDLRERWPGQVGASTARDDSANNGGPLGGGNERRGCTGARSKYPIGSQSRSSRLRTQSVARTMRVASRSMSKGCSRG